MEAYWSFQNLLNIYHGDALKVLDELPASSVHCIVTSPPYFGHRNYRGPRVIWGDDKYCPHNDLILGERVWGKSEQFLLRGNENEGLSLTGTGTPETSVPGLKAGGESIQIGGEECLGCGAWRGALGQEPLHDCLGWAKGIWCKKCFVCHIVFIFQKLKRVLRDDGVSWLNIGNSYAGSWGNYHPNSPPGKHGQRLKDENRWKRSAYEDQTFLPATANMPARPTDSLLIPHRVALALQADGWYVRQDVIWYKPSAIPISVNGWRWEKHRIKIKGAEKGAPNYKSSGRLGEAGGDDNWDIEGHGYMRMDGTDDAAVWEECAGCQKCQENDGYLLRKGSWRPSSAHEFVLMLAKVPQYFADLEAAREPLAESSIKRIKQSNFDQQTGGDRDYEMSGINPNNSSRKSLERLRNRVLGRPSGNKHRIFQEEGLSRDRVEAHLGYGIPYDPIDVGRNPRSVWFIASKPFNLHVCKGCEAVYNGKEYGVLLKSKYKRVCSKCNGSEWLEHFALFPPELTAKCIEASTPEAGVCMLCGSPWARVLQRGELMEYPEGEGGKVGDTVKMVRTIETTDWKPTCKCIGLPERVPATVLDPFMGTGTTLLAAAVLGRKGIGIDLSEDYCRLAKIRIEKAFEQRRSEE